MRIHPFIPSSLPLAVSLLATIAAGSLSGCGADAVTPSVSGTAPLRAFRGRSSDILLSGSGTHWDGSAQVSFGDGITVNKVTAASPTALVANITVAATAALGPRDITVTQGGDSSPYKMAFLIESSIDVEVKGSTAQGSVVFLTIENKDLEHLFDDTSTGGGLFSAPVFTNIDIKSPTGTAVNISSVTPFRIDATMLIDTTATAGAFDLDVKSGPVDGTRDSFAYPAVLTIAARTALPLTGSVSLSIAKPFDSQLYTLTPGGVDHQVSITLTADDPDASPSIVVLSKSGAFKDLITNGDAATWLPTNADPVYVLVYDGAGLGGYSISIAPTDVFLTTQVGGEGDNAINNVATTPVVLGAPPIRVKGASLSGPTDVDWYRVSVPAGKRIRAQTVAGDDADTTVTFYQNDGTTTIGSEIDNGAGENALSPALPGAGDYLVRIAASSYFSASAPGYDLIVTLE